MEDEKVKQLAETLRKNGLAASEYEAIEKAKSILNVRTQREDASQEGDVAKHDSETKNEQAMPNLNIDIKNQNTPLNELMKEINVTPEQVEAQKQEKLDDIETEVNEIKKDIKQAEKSPEKTEQLKEEIAKVKDNLDKVEEVKAEKEPQNKQQAEQDDMFKEEKKIDLTKVFNQNK